MQWFVGLLSAECGEFADGKGVVFADADLQADVYRFGILVAVPDADADPDRRAYRDADRLADADSNADADPHAGILAGNRQSRGRGRAVRAVDDRPGDGLQRHPDDHVDDLLGDRDDQPR